MLGKLVDFEVIRCWNDYLPPENTDLVGSQRVAQWTSNKWEPQETSSREPWILELPKKTYDQQGRQSVEVMMIMMMLYSHM
ncbi:jg16260 [Pararge aegeria aegeria]|uniref:Jg16260 protein n=1 Tax=Pararge aegeria aegeria TaxID=348720 RepID=A0A8S4RUW0_9NEOP|nr:jg16260 [Pararge aegeria aegeria]